jgi:hypothetical protein
MDEAKLPDPAPLGPPAGRRPGSGRDNLLEAARRFLLCCEDSLAQAGPPGVPRRHLSLATAGRVPEADATPEEARAEAELRAAVAALCGGLMRAAAQLQSPASERPGGGTPGLGRRAEA